MPAWCRRPVAAGAPASLSRRRQARTRHLARSRSAAGTAEGMPAPPPSASHERPLHLAARRPGRAIHPLSAMAHPNPLRPVTKAPVAAIRPVPVRGNPPARPSAGEALQPDREGATPTGSPLAPKPPRRRPPQHAAATRAGRTLGLAPSHRIAGWQEARAEAPARPAWMARPHPGPHPDREPVHPRREPSPVILSLPAPER